METLRPQSANVIPADAPRTMAEKAKKARLAMLLGKYEAETDQELKQKLADRIWSMIHRIRFGDFGFSAQGALACAAVGAFAVIGYGYYHATHGIVRYGHPDGSPGGDVVRILRKYDDERFKMRWVRKETAPGRSVDFTLNFCDAMDIGPGETLIFLAYREIGSCAEALEPHEEVGYLFAHAKNGRATLAHNCKEVPTGVADKTVVVCSPSLNEADFSGEE